MLLNFFIIIIFADIFRIQSSVKTILLFLFTNLWFYVFVLLYFYIFLFLLSILSLLPILG